MLKWIKATNGDLFCYHPETRKLWWHVVVCHNGGCYLYSQQGRLPVNGRYDRASVEDCKREAESRAAQGC